MSWWSSIFRSRAQDWTYGHLQASQVPSGATPQPVAANAAYLTVRLASMRVVNVRQGLGKFYGAVHSLMSLAHRSGAPAEFSVLTTPDVLKKIDAKRLDRVVLVGKKLLGPVPYRGGDVNIEVGLFSIKEEELAGPFLTVLESLSNVAGVALVKTALPFAKPLTEGIALLTGSTDATILEIGLAAALAPPSTGYLVVMRAPKGAVALGGLKLTSGDLRLVDAASGQPVRDYPYLVLEISASDKRDEWFDIPDLKETYQELQDAARKGKVEDAKAAFSVFRRAALVCDDLLQRDGERIVELVEGELKTALQTMLTAGGGDTGLRDLRQYAL